MTDTKLKVAQLIPSRNFDYSKRSTLMAQNRAETVTSHRRGKRRTGKPRKPARPPQTLRDCDLATLAALCDVFPSHRYAAEIAEVTGFTVDDTDRALSKLYALGVVSCQARCKGYRLPTWLARPGRRGLGASPAVKALLATYLADRSAVNVHSSPLTDTEQTT